MNLIGGISTLSSILVLYMALWSCGTKNSSAPSVSRGSNSGYFSIAVVNECQYIVFKNGYAGGIAHAGNCNNPIHHASFTNHLNRTKGDTLAGPDAIGTASGIKNRLPITRLGGGCGGLAGI